MAFGWEGSKVRLVPLDKARHLENAVLWLNDPKLTAWTLIGDFPLTQLAEEDYFNSAMKMDNARVAFAIETLDEQHIGFSGIDGIDWRNSVGNTGTIIGREDLWGQGYGTDSALVRSRYAFDVLGVRMLMSRVFADNAASLRMLKRAGYVEVGRLPKRYWKRGAFRDEIILMIDRDMWAACPVAEGCAPHRD